VACGLLALDPFESSGEAKYAEEGSGGLLVARCNRSPLFEPGPEPLDDIAVVVDPVWTGHAARDLQLRTDAPDVFAEAVTSIALISHNLVRRF
jgi:hypothetical protein